LGFFFVLCFLFKEIKFVLLRANIFSLKKFLFKKKKKKKN